MGVSLDGGASHILVLSQFDKSHRCVATSSLIIMIALALVLKCFGGVNMILHDPMRNRAAVLGHWDLVIVVWHWWCHHEFQSRK